VRIFLEKMVFDFPGVVDAELVGEFDLIERLLKQPVFVAFVPWPWKLVFVENTEFHGRSLARIPQKPALDLIGGGCRFCEQNTRKAEFLD
jgi:hypothetical protein